MAVSKAVGMIWSSTDPWKGCIALSEAKWQVFETRRLAVESWRGSGVVLTAERATLTAVLVTSLL